MNDNREREELLRQHEELFVRQHQAALEELLAPYRELFEEMTAQYMNIILEETTTHYKAVVEDITTQYMRALCEKLGVSDDR